MAVDGTYELKVTSQWGNQDGTLILKEESDGLSGNLSGKMIGSTDFSGGTLDGNDANWEMDMKLMGVKFKMTITATFDGDSISGTMNTTMGDLKYTGQKQG